MTVVRASDEITDAIALIEMQRQYMEKESGLASACNEALRKLQALLDQETAATQPPGPTHTVNIEAVMIEIRRIKKLAGVASQNIILKHARSGRQKPASRPNGSRNPSRDKGRRTMGRRGDR